MDANTWLTRALQKLIDHNPPLTAAEERRLATRAKQLGLTQDRDRIIFSILRWIIMQVTYAVSTLDPKDRSAVDRNDLVQAGLKGAYRAWQRFNVGLGFRLLTFAGLYILQEIRVELRSQLKHRHTLSLDALCSEDNDDDKETWLDTLEDLKGVSAEQVTRQVKVVEEWLKTLTETQRRCVELYYYNGLSIPEIYKVTGIPVNTIKSHLRRARGKWAACRA